MKQRKDRTASLPNSPAARLVGAVLALTLWLGSDTSQAASITYVTPIGATAGGQPVNDTATFTTSAGQVLITIQNLQANPTSDIQTLNGVSFTLSTGQTAVTSFTQMAVQRTVNDNGAGDYSDTGTPLSVIMAPDKWNSNVVGGVSVEITSIGNTGGHGTLIGPPDGSNAYSSANSSITNGNHNPFMAGTATFVLSITGVLATSTITAMRFEFGTESGTNVTGIPGTASVPEPGTLTMASTAALLALGAAWHKRNRSRR